MGCAAAGRGQQQHTTDQKTRKRRNVNTCCPVPTSTEARVVILDLEKGVHAVKLVLSVREAVLRRWEETASARQWKREQDKLWNMESNCTDANNDGGKFNTTMNEQRQIELAIASCLGRINIIQPRDFSYLSLVATLEALRHSLDEKRDAAMKEDSTAGSSSITRLPESPTLIMIDALTTLDATTRHLESLPTKNADGNRCSSSGGGGTGLSERNEFYRQLNRLREVHEIAIFATSRCLPTNVKVGRPNEQPARIGGKLFGSSYSSSSLWEKMVSHRISLHHVVEGTQECQAGYDFVAILKTKGVQEVSRVFPYSIMAGGIAC